MPRFKVGHEKRVSTGFTINPTTLKEAKDKAGRVPLSSIIEDLLDQWIHGKVELQEAPT